MGIGTLHFSTFRTRGVYANYAAFRDEIEKAVEQEVLPVARELAEERVVGWRTPPEFVSGVTVNNTGIYGLIIPTGPGAVNWIRVSRGVEGHWIQVQKTATYRGYGGYKPALRLNRYVPSSIPGEAYGGVAFRLPPTGYRRRVWWPGIQPRNFEEDIVKDLRPIYYPIIRTAVARGVRRAQKEGSPPRNVRG